MPITPILQSQLDFSKARLDIIGTKIHAIQELAGMENMCIYVTGSYGRHEATEHSDLDLFFIGAGTSSKNHIPKLKKILIDAELIKIVNELKFPPFSNDGQFLEIHYLEDIKEHLGSPNDDFNNFFTARLLLLLESFPLYNETFYQTVIMEMITTYYRDFHDHNNNFLPTFLVNDVIRYWKTLCLNYEHRRNRPDESKKSKTHVKNLKLVFSRKLTCFSLIISIISNYDNLNENKLSELIRMTPIERLNRVAAQHPAASHLIDEIFNLYSWFIEMNNQSEDKLLKWMSLKDNRNLAFEKGKKDFGGKIFELLTKLTEDKVDILKFLVI